MSKEYEEKAEEFTKQFSETSFTVPNEDMEEHPEEVGGSILGDKEPLHEEPDELSSKEVKDTHRRDSSEVSSIPNPPKKNKNPFEKRINRLSAEKGDAEQRAFFYEQQSREKDRILAEQAERLRLLEQDNAKKQDMVYSQYESSLNDAETAAKRAYREARESGDIDAETEAASSLAEIKASRVAYRQQAMQEKHMREQREYEEPYVPLETNQRYPNQYDEYQRQAPQVDDDYQDWLEENPWYQGNAKLRQEADSFAQELKSHLDINNAWEGIDVNTFRNAVAEEVKQRYRVRQEQQQPENEYEEDSRVQEAPSRQNYPQKQPVRNDYNPQPTSSVSPVTRRGTTMADQYIARNASNSSNKINLRPEEYNVAKHLAGTDTRTGKYLSESEALRRYAENKKTLANQPRATGFVVPD